jgi:hypothetical protein
LYLTLREVTKGNGCVNKRRRFETETGVKGVRAGRRSASVWEKVDALKGAVFV